MREWVIQNEASIRLWLSILATVGLLVACGFLIKAGIILRRVGKDLKGGD